MSQKRKKKKEHRREVRDMRMQEKMERKAVKIATAVSLGMEVKLKLEDKKKNKFMLLICKREEYIKAWQTMYALGKRAFDQPMFDGVNPMLNKKPLGTEVENWCIIAFDSQVECAEFDHGMPVGIFSMVITKNRNGGTKPIGKQYVVHPDYQRKGIGKAMMVALEKKLVDEGYDWYYIGCSEMSSKIEISLGREAYNSDIEHDMYKFNVQLDRDMVTENFKKFVSDRGFGMAGGN